MFIDKQEDFYQVSDLSKMSEELFYNVSDNQTLYLYLEKFSGNIYKHYTELFLDESRLPVQVSGTCLPFAKKCLSQ